MRRAATSHRTVAAENVVVTSGSCKNCREISDDGAKGSGAAGPETREYAGEIAKSIVLTRLCHPVCSQRARATTDLPDKRVRIIGASKIRSATRASVATARRRCQWDIQTSNLHADCVGLHCIVSVVRPR